MSRAAAWQRRTGSHRQWKTGNEKHIEKVGVNYENEATTGHAKYGYNIFCSRMQDLLWTDTLKDNLVSNRNVGDVREVTFKYKEMLIVG